MLVFSTSKNSNEMILTSDNGCDKLFINADLYNDDPYHCELLEVFGNDVLNTLDNITPSYSNVITNGLGVLKFVYSAKILIQLDSDCETIVKKYDNCNDGEKNDFTLIKYYYLTAEQSNAYFNDCFDYRFNFNCDTVSTRYTVE